MDEGWTRWVFEKYDIFYLDNKYCKLNFVTTTNSDFKNENLSAKVNTIIFPDQAPNQMLNGHAKGSMPDEYTGGIGKDGVTNLKKFVEDGGTLVFLNRASDFAIEQFNLPIKDVTEGLNRKDFFIPGSILRTEFDTDHPIAKGMPKDSIAWFENSPAFEITISDDTNVEIIARYPARRKIFCFRAGRWGRKKLRGKPRLFQSISEKVKLFCSALDRNIALRVWRHFRCFLTRLRIEKLIQIIFRLVV